MFLPAFGEMYSAAAGEEARRDAAPLPPLVPEPPNPHSFLFVPCREYPGMAVRYEGKYLSLAAATLHLIFVATGRALGAAIEPTRAFDIAAGAIILERAGGALRTVSGAEVNYAAIADGSRTAEPVVAAAAAQVDFVRGCVSWED